MSPGIMETHQDSLSHSMLYRTVAALAIAVIVVGVIANLILEARKPDCPEASPGVTVIYDASQCHKKAQ